MALLINLNAYYGAISDEDRCKILKKLPVVAKDFQTKFKDPKATLVLYNEHKSIFYNRSKPSCLDDATFNSLLEEYARLVSLNDDSRTLEKLIKNSSPIGTDGKVLNGKAFLYKYLGDLYKKRSRSDERKHQRMKAEYRLLALKNYNIYIDSGGKADKNMKIFLKNKGLFKAKNRWFDKFTIDSVPTNNYRVIYFNSNEPNKVVKEDKVAYPAVNYEHDKFPGHKLPSEDFAAYWVGDIAFDKDVEKVLNFRVSWSEYRLIIDGYEVSKGNKSGAEVPYLFTKGKHRIEVEYLNNYGATDFMMTMYDKREYIPTQEIKNNLSGDYVLLYVGLYESDNFNNSLKIKLDKKYDKPVVLLLYSYGNIDWKIYPNGNDFKAIFVSSQAKGSIVDMKEDKTVKMYYLKNFSAATSLGIKCRCSNYNVYCNGKSFSEFDKRILNMFGKPLNGYTTLYPRERAKNITLSVPKVALDDKMRKKISLDEKEADHIKSECIKEKNLGIDDIF